MPRRRAAFVLAELVLVLALGVLILALAAAAAERAGRGAMASGSAANLQRFAAATSAFGADYEDRLWGFTWKAGDSFSEFEDLNNAPTDTQAAANQAVHILRTHGNRPDMPKITGWQPHVFYSQLPLYVYLGQELPSLWGVSPANKHRLAWAKDPAGFDKGDFLPNQPPPGGANKRWPYSSSYETPPAWWDQGDVGARVYQNGDWQIWMTPPNANFGPSLLTDAAFASGKVLIHETREWHAARVSEGTAFYCPTARVQLLFADGSAAQRTTREANPGWQPNNPGSLTSTSLSGGGCFAPAAYRFTRGGVTGRDFGGPEDWGK